MDDRRGGGAQTKLAAGFLGGHITDSSVEVTAQKRLIERDVLHLEASMAGLRERYSRGETQQTIHVWWARRPHAAMRALILYSLLTDYAGISLGQAFDDLGVQAVRRALAAAYGRRPKVLDPFGGGGTIPYEAAYLGARAYSIDSNALAAFIQASNLKYSAVLKQPGVMELLETSGKRALAILGQATARLFPLRPDGALSYVWSYAQTCDNCRHDFSLSKRPWLSTKNGRKIFHQITGSGVEIHRTGNPKPSNWVGNRGNATCERCGHVQKPTLKTAADRLCCVIRRGKPAGKIFGKPAESALPARWMMDGLEADTLRRLKAQLPATLVPKWSGIVNPGIYGMETHADHFNQRQRCVMLALIQALQQVHEENRMDHGEEVARGITCILSGLIDQLVDWNSRLSVWIPQNEQVGRALCGPGIAMLWDYTETDPVGGGPSNLLSKLDRILRGAEALCDLPSQVETAIGSALALPYEDGTFDAVITDPPYYDNIFYAPLADFVYTWKRMLLEKIVPEYFQSKTTDENSELVCSSIRAGSTAKAHERYCQMLARALQEAGRVLHSDGLFAIIYSHASIKGWCAMVEAFQRSVFTVQNAQPLAIERRERPRAMTSDAVNTCIVFVARVNGGKRDCSDEEAWPLVQAEVHRAYIEELKRLGWTDADAGVALLARALVPLCNVRTTRQAIESLVVLTARQVARMCPSFELTNRKSL